MPRRPEHVTALARALGVTEDALLVDALPVREQLAQRVALVAAGEGRA